MCPAVGSHAVTSESRLPVIIGIGQHTQREVDFAVDPARLMGVAVQRALDDAGLTSSTDIDLMAVVRCLSIKHCNIGRLIESDLGLNVRRTMTTAASGNTPQALANHLANRIVDGDLDLAVVVGGETWRSRMRARKEAVEVDWRVDDSQPDEMFSTDLPYLGTEEANRQIVMPVIVYPMFESALRAHLGRTPDEHLAVISELYERFSEVAAANPYAWSRTARSATEIATAGPSNRMIGLPYTKYMNSNNDVDMAAGYIICSVERARALGVSQDRWVYLHAGTDAHDTYQVGERGQLHDAPAIRIAGRQLLQMTGIGAEQIDLVDLYSCFPVAVELGAAALGLALDRQLTMTGGLQFNGGPWNNYVSHAICTMVDALRSKPGATGLIWGNGGAATKHSFGLYSTTPPAQGYLHADVQDEVDRLPTRTVALAPDAAGPAIVEGYTVMHDRDGRPERAVAACLLNDGRRAWGDSTDRAVAAELCDGEWVGRAVTLDAEGRLRPDRKSVV